MVLPYPPPHPSPFSLRDDSYATCQSLVFGEGGLTACNDWVSLSMDAQQFRFPSLAPRVERGLPWSLPRPFCLSPGFSFPVDPYRTGEFRLTASVASRVFVGGGATHTMPRAVPEWLYEISHLILLSQDAGERLRCFSFENFLFTSL